MNHETHRGRAGLAAAACAAMGVAFTAGAGFAQSDQSGGERCFDKGTLTYYDCPTEAPAPVAPAAPQQSYQPAPSGPDFTGVYIGAHGGYAWAQMEGAYTGASGAYDLSNQSPEGWLAGGQIGYLRQFDNNFTLGAELDFSWAWADDDLTNGADALDSELHWLSSARLRAGYAVGSVMPYVTGGVAMAGYEFTGTSPGFSAGGDETTFGGVAGGGVDWMVSDSVVLRAEGLYYFFDDEQDISGATGTPGDSAGLGDVGVARVGVSFKF